MLTKSIKIELRECVDFPNGNTKKEKHKMLLKELDLLQYQCCQAANRAITDYYLWEKEKIEYKKQNNKLLNDKEKYGQSFQNVVYHRLSQQVPVLNSSNKSQLNQLIIKRWNSEKKKVLKHLSSLPSFKKEFPIPIYNNNYKIEEYDDNKYKIKISLFSRGYPYQQLTFITSKLDNYIIPILNRIINGSYKKGSGQMSLKKNKIFFTLSYSFKSEEKELDENKILGIDLGIKNVIAMQIYNKTNNNYEKASLNECLIEGGELVAYKKKIENRRKQLKKQTKWCGSGRIGHGRKHRMEKALEIGEKIKNFKCTYNHKISRYVVDFAVKHQCKYIKMENLDKHGFKSEILNNWTYYDLQQKIISKAKENGIEVILIPPAYTSQRCSKCGNVDKESRKTRDDFQCVECGHKENADINAAKNICVL